MKKIKRLYRPVGLHEMVLILQSGNKAFPPRLFFQPIFYPVLNKDYAIQIARDWNVGDEASGFSGFVTYFDIDDFYISQFPLKNVGDSTHNEIWVPAVQLSEFNNEIIGEIWVDTVFYGNKYNGVLADASDVSLLSVFFEKKVRPLITGVKRFQDLLTSDQWRTIVNLPYFEKKEWLSKEELQAIVTDSFPTLNPNIEVVFST